MKTLKTLFLGLLLGAATLCHAQITEPGWYRAAAQPMVAQPISDLVAQAQFQGEGQSSSQGVPSSPVAEAITPQIQALANGLQDNPQEIFAYVHDHIKFVLYFGSKKGAQLTLLEKSGNDFDQCALLVALLRSAGYTNVQYQFGWEQIPYDDPYGMDYDLHHWWHLTLDNTNWTNTINYVEYLTGTRGYPALYYYADGNTFEFQRMWVALTIGSTTYQLDPAFKTSEQMSGISLTNAMGSGVISNALLTAAAGTDTGNYAQSLNEGAVRNALTGYTTNLLNYIQSNAPNYAVQGIYDDSEPGILNSWATIPVDFSIDYNTNTWFYVDTFLTPVLGWANEPTNIMSTLQISFAGTNYQWFMPQLQGQRLSLTYNGSETAQLWQDDTMLAQGTASATGGTNGVVLTITHPVGTWNVTSNVFVYNPTNLDNQTITNSFQSTNATYAILYAFEPDWGWLQQRENMLDTYLEEGLTNGSRQVTSETLNIMGLSWMLQTEQIENMLAPQLGILPQYFHRVGPMAQESGRGYHVDVSEISGGLPSGGWDTAHIQIMNTDFDITTFFASAMEHGIIEQLQNSNLVAASTVKMLEIANTNGQAVYLASSTNWTTGYNVKSHLTSYSSSTETDISNLISSGCYVLLPQNGSNQVSSASGSWSGCGYEGRGETNGSGTGAELMPMRITGGYNGGYVSNPTAAVNTGYTDEAGQNQPAYYAAVPVSTPAPTIADPVDAADGTFQVENTDLSLGQAEPRGITLSRYYNGTRRFSNSAGLAGGWIHNYSITANNFPAPQACLGGTTPAQAASMLTATAAAIAMYNGGYPDAKNWLTTALIAKWGVDQLDKSGVSVNLGKDTLQFVQQPNGVFTPPANCTATLTQSGSAYSLQQRHGNTFHFNSSGVLTNIVDQYNQSLTVTNNASNWVSKITDWKGRSLTFTYTGSPAHLTSVSDGTRTVSYGYSTTYNPQGDLTSFTDAQGNTSTYTYDTNHQITATLDAQSRLVVSNLYDTQGHVTTQYTEGLTNKTWQIFWSGWTTVELDPANGEMDYLYDDQGRLGAVFDQLGNETATYYDGQNHIIYTESPLDEFNQFFYDSSNNLVQKIDELGFTNQFFYDKSNNLVRTIDPRGNTTTFGYNAQFSLTGQTNGAGDFVNYTYNTSGAVGTLASRTDSGGTTTYGYDSYGQLNLITYPGSLGSESFANSSLGDVTNHTDARGFSTAFQYNNRRQLTNTVAPTNLITQIAYDPVGNTASTTDPRGNITSNTWSATHKLLATTLPSTPQGTPIVTNIYDNRDWLTGTRDPLQYLTQYTNDLDGRLISQTDPLSRTTLFGYDADSHKIATTNAAGETTFQSWDARSELIQFIDGAGHSLFRGYDAVGNQVNLTNRNGNVWQFQFDAANRLTNTISPLGRSTSLAFNHQGLLSSMKDPLSQTTTYGYDAKGRMTNRTDNVATTAYSYDANDNRTNVTESGNTIAWTYDAYNRISSCKDIYGNLIQYHYDGSGNLTNLVYPGGKNVYYAYDGLNHMTNVTDWSGRKTTLAYDLDGRLTTLIRPNGSYRTIAYDAAGQATNILEQMANGLPIAVLQYNWDNAARVQWEFLAPLPHTATIPTRTMEYNADNQLTNVDGTGVTVDLDGNMTAGPLTNDTAMTYAYDARNRLFNAGGVTNAYDAMNNRVGQTTGTSTNIYVINPNATLPQMLMRIKNGVTNYYVYGPGLLYQVTEGATATNTLTYHYDYRGSTIALSGDNGLVTDRIEYSTYGLTTYRAGTNDTPFLFNGYYGVMTDPNGLLYMRARYYNPYICRFLNPDPSGFSGGLNFYAYASGDPVSLLDPFGLWSWTQTFGVLRVAGGGLEAAAGYSLAAAGVGLSSTGIGAIVGVPLALAGTFVGAHGADQVIAGAAQASYGVRVDSYTSQNLQAVGMSQNAANLTDAGISIVGSFGAGAGASAVTASQLAASSSVAEVANAPLITQMAYYEAGQLSLSEDAYAYYSLWPNAVDRGAAMVADQGWVGASSMGSTTLGASEGTLFTTGLPTALGSGVGGSFFSGLSYGGQSYLGSSSTSSSTGK